MRLEFNPRALCYNLYCDTMEENEKLKQMLKMPITAKDIKSLDSNIYADTDSVNAMKTHLNSVYGKAVTDMNKNFIVVHNSKNELGIIFKNNIAGAVKHDNGTADILLASGYTFYAIDKYEDIIKQLI